MKKPNSQAWCSSSCVVWQGWWPGIRSCGAPLFTHPWKLGKVSVCFGYSMAVTHGNPESTWTLFPKPDGVSIQKNLGTNFIRTITSSRQDQGRLKIGGWHRRRRLVEGRRPLAGISLSAGRAGPLFLIRGSQRGVVTVTNASLNWKGLLC